MKPPIYNGPLIEDVHTLLSIGNISGFHLQQILEHPSNHYFLKLIPKSNGKKRETYIVRHPLKHFQTQLVNEIFHKVEFPIYLQGSLKSDRIPRGSIVDAKMHSEYKNTLTFDIKNFFSSIKYEYVLGIWENFFRLPENLANILAKATTLKGFVPQGASTSSYIGNLVFFDKEHELVSLLQQHSYFYTRYVDDINISTNRRLREADINFITDQIHNLLYSKELEPNRKKTRIQLESQQRVIHNLNINAGVPKLSQKNRLRIRSAVKECENEAARDRFSVSYSELFKRTYGRVGYMYQLHPKQAQAYFDRLNKIKPLDHSSK